MKSAILYIRVSTDEQADKGYSQRNQDEVLQRYCAAKSIQVAQIIYEDHSAKTFNRPAWKEMLKNIKKSSRKNLPNLILFTKWDRFSRNTSDAYQMISLLNSYGIEPQAVEQPIDLSVPENKMMLAFYLAVPEVENDRRGLNIFYGIRRAKKEGRWMGHAPVGYENKTDDTGRKYIRPNIPQARLMKHAFEELATGRYSIEQVWKKAKSHGLKSQSNNFHTAIRNPVYCGKIVVPAFQDETLHTVTGQHEAIISEALFSKVQLLINGNKQPQKGKFDSLTHFPLRGFIQCDRCSRMLTASASKGRNAIYYYYHCTSTCGTRYKAELINNGFITHLSQFNTSTVFKRLFKEIARDVFKVRNQSAISTRAQNLKKTESLHQRLQKLREMLIDEKLDIKDYHVLKNETELKIASLSTELAHLGDPDASITKHLHHHAPRFLNLAELYKKASVKDQRKICALIYPQPLQLKDQQLKLPELSLAVKLIFKR